MGSNNWKLANNMASVSSRFKLSKVSGFSVLETRKGLDVLSSRVFSFPTSHTMTQGDPKGKFRQFFLPNSLAMFKLNLLVFVSKHSRCILFPS